MRDDGSGNPTLVKHAIDDGCHRLRHEAEILVAASGANIVELVGLDAHENRCELSLRYLEAATLAEHPALDLAELLRVLLGVGTAVAELHRRGICHGALGRNHILVEPHGSPVLCGFGEATGPEDLQQHPSASDLTALASLAEVELTRTEHMVVSAIERRHCGEARAACRDLAARAVAAPNDSVALSAWLVHIAGVRASVIRERQAPLGGSVQESSPLPAVAAGQRDLRDLLGFGASVADAEGIRRGSDKTSGAVDGGARDRRRFAAAGAAAAVVLVIAFIGWQTLMGSGRQESPDIVGTVGETLRDTSTTALVSPQQPRAVAAAGAAGAATPSSSDGGGSTPTSSLGAAALAEVSGRATLIYATSSADCEYAVAELPTTQTSSPQSRTTAPVRRAAKSKSPMIAEAGIARPGQTLITDNRYRSKAFETDLKDIGITVLRPATKNEAPRPGARFLRPLRQIIESINRTLRPAHLDVNGDGCRDGVHIEPAVADRPSSTISTPFGRWRLGTEGDLIAVGDWNCDGRSTLAVVRPHSGLAAFYESWPRSARSVGPARIVTVPRHATAVSAIAAQNNPPLDDIESSPASSLNNANVAEISCDVLVILYGELAIEVAPRDLGYEAGLDLNSDIG